MTSGHIAHNCRIGNRTVIASCALVAGHAVIEDDAFISGGVVIHQYSRIGRLAMIAGNTSRQQATRRRISSMPAITSKPRDSTWWASGSAPDSP